ncbi:MAG: AAA family ATPase [Rhodoferax sp.]|nr:AAA family ATPase [Rhodoferax sp.]
MSSLYLDHFGLHKPPFQITPDLDFFFAGGHRGDILSGLLHVAEHEEGIITLVAEVGSGKTLLARLMLSRLGPHISTVYLANPSFGRDEILGAIARDLGLVDLPASTEARLAALQQELLRRHALGQRVLLAIDEAHAMPAESLEEVRLLSNLETGQHKLVNIMLFGQPELDELLADRRLRQVRDRVVHRFKLLPLPPPEASAYVDHRLRAAGWRGGALFSPQAMVLLIKAAGGRARRINLLADKALLAAYAQGMLVVQPQQVQEAIGELHDDFSGPASSARPVWLKWLALSTGLAVCMTGISVWMLERWREGVAVPGAVHTQPLTNPAGALALPSASMAKPTVPFQAAVAQVKSSSPAAAAAAAVAAAAVVPDADLQSYVTRAEAYLRTPELAGFTLQVAALPRDASVAKYVKMVGQYVDSKDIFVLQTHYNGHDYVSVFVGRFATLTQANATLADLPAPLKSNKPLIRTWSKIKQDQSS